MKFDWDFVVRDCHGDLDAIRRRVERHFREIRNEALEEAADLAEKLVDDGWFEVGPEIRALKTIALIATEDEK